MTFSSQIRQFDFDEISKLGNLSNGSVKNYFSSHGTHVCSTTQMCTVTGCRVSVSSTSYTHLQIVEPQALSGRWVTRASNYPSVARRQATSGGGCRLHGWDSYVFPLPLPSSGARVGSMSHDMRHKAQVRRRRIDYLQSGKERSRSILILDHNTCVYLVSKKFIVDKRWQW